MTGDTNLTGWVDTATAPPRRLPDDLDAALAYVTDAIGHPVYTRWTLTLLKRGCPSLADAKRDHPVVFALLLDQDAAVEYWERGRLRVAAPDQAPTPVTVLLRLLRQHRRFRFAPDGPATSSTSSRIAAEPASGASPATTAVAVPDLTPPVGHPVDPPSGAAVWLATLAPAPDPAGRAWLARAGRFANLSSVTNTLGVADDAQAVTLFLRERASRSPHTLRAYLAELRRLIQWCDCYQLGPLSDLTRENLLTYRTALERLPRTTPARDTSQDAPRNPPAGLQATTRARALAVVSSLFRYWLRTGYVIANPAAELSGGAPTRDSWTPSRIMPAAVLALCDAVICDAAPGTVSKLVWARRRAIWSLYRYAGVRLAELEWSDAEGLPRLDVDAQDQWTLHVLGKGNKRRAIPLPSVCIPVLPAYRLARGLPERPSPFERIALIHSGKRDALGHSGLYDEVKAVLLAAEARVTPGDAAALTLLRAASTHWLRHGYARTLVVDHAVPLPVAQTLLGHASVQTTAAYAKTDLAQTRAFVEGSFPQPK
ncbi:Site-specific recombinase XerD [Paraburkholderia fungorum]|uniref:Site-specific recombinase XerD n=1 Tax=Paraburkholderia fungorum TaxID=134537 RepID=A0A1H1JMR4_9BURK|nr:tyrosine-type recombinase/integrase [Paraburkholderia fungorum]SDR51273.1 Site-specific recombinase XerD [Paraburkholderia fungorum]